MSLIKADEAPLGISEFLNWKQNRSLERSLCKHLGENFNGRGRGRGACSLGRFAYKLKLEHDYFLSQTAEMPYSRKKRRTAINKTAVAEIL